MAAETLSVIDYGIIIIYLVAVTAIGAWFVRREKTSSEYYLAGRKITWPYIGASLFASNISAEHYVAYAGGAYALGIVVGTTEFLAPLNLCCLAVLFLPFYLRSKVFTIPHFLEKRFTPTSRFILSILMLLLNVFTRLAVGLWAGALIMKTMAGWDTTVTIWVIGVLTAVYTLLGGLAAVIYTETLQMVIMYAGGTLLAILSLKAVGGWSEMIRQLPPQHIHWARSIRDTDLPWTAFTVPWFLAGMFYWCMDQTIVQRALGAKTLDHARKASLFAGYLKVWHMFIFVLPGLCALILAPNLEKPDQAYPVMISKLLPIGMKGVLLSAALAAIMSTLASTFNSTATLIVHDFVLKSKPNLSQKGQVFIGYIAIAVMAAAGIFWAPFMERFESLWVYIMRVSFYLQVPVVGVFMLGIMWRRTTSQAAMLGLAVGVAMGMICLFDDMQWIHAAFLNHWLLKPFPHRGFLALFLSTVMTVVWTLCSPKEQISNEVKDITLDWKNPQILTAEPGPLWKDWRIWLAGLIILDLFFYFKFI